MSAALRSATGPPPPLAHARFLRSRNSAKTETGSASGMPIVRLNIRLLRAQKGIGQAFERDRRRQCICARRAQLGDMFGALAQDAVGGIDAEGEFGVGQRIFVAAIDLRFAGQRGEPHQRMIENLRRLLEGPPAAHRKQRVADEDEVLFFELVGDMAAGVARNLDDARPERADGDLIVLADHPVETADLGRLFGGPDDARARETRLEAGNALHVIRGDA